MSHSLWNDSHLSSLKYTGATRRCSWYESDVVLAHKAVKITVIQSVVTQLLLGQNSQIGCFHTTWQTTLFCGHQVSHLRSIVFVWTWDRHNFGCWNPLTLRPSSQIFGEQAETTCMSKIVTTLFSLLEDLPIFGDLFAQNVVHPLFFSLSENSCHRWLAWIKLLPHEPRQYKLQHYFWKSVCDLYHSIPLCKWLPQK